jgi:hypothetical protein
MRMKESGLPMLEVLILNNRVNGVLAVTRALGDAYMKDLVTGHPYTTETVIQPILMNSSFLLAME